MRKRLFCLVLPLLVWILIYEVSQWPCVIVGNVMHGRNLFCGIGNHVGGIWQMLGMDSDHWSMARRLWFIRVLISYVIISPLLVFAIQKFGLWLICLLVVCNIAFYDNFSHNIIYYGVGLAIGLRP